AGTRGERDVLLTSRVVREPGRLGRSLALYLSGLTFLVVGIVVLVLRPPRAIARLFVFTHLVGALGILAQALTPTRDFLDATGTAVYLASQHGLIVAYAVTFAFYNRFPDGRPRSRLTLGAERFLGVWALLQAVGFALVQWASQPSARPPFSIGRWLPEALL